MKVDPRAANKWLAVIIPFVELLIFAYSAYVVTAEVAINWLLSPPSASSYAARPGPAIAVLVIYFVLLLLTLSSLIRILYVVHTDPGYVPLPTERHGKTKDKQSGANGDAEPNTRTFQSRANEDIELGVQDFQSRSYVNNIPEPDPVGFYGKDSFVCNPIGRPNWCDRCKNYKPDRAHHSSDVGRCVRGLDHYCPWAGGIVAQNNHKFFNQFCVYTALLCIVIIVTSAVCINERKRDGLTGGHNFVNLVVILPFAAFFGLFTATISIVHLGYALSNVTTIETLQSRAYTWVAVYVGHPSKHPNVKSEIINYPLPDTGKESTRAFAILRAEPGTNVFDMGKWQNFNLRMGYTVWDWFLPIRRSPMSTFYERSGLNCDYPLGDEVTKLKKKWLKTDP